MFAHRGGICKPRSKAAALAALACLLLLLPGCGGGEDPPTITASTSPTEERGSSAATADADPADLRVIEAWSRALSEGDLEAAAGYFAQPSTAQNGPLTVRIRSLEDALTFNDSLPCGARVIAASSDGGVTEAKFRLTDRPGGGCGAGTGGTASTAFEIDDGKIVEWRRIDQPPSGEGGGGGEGAPTPGDPA